MGSRVRRRTFLTTARGTVIVTSPRALDTEEAAAARSFGERPWHDYYNPSPLFGHRETGAQMNHRMSRRLWLKGGAVFALAPRRFVLADDPAAAISAVEARGKEIGLPPFQTSRSAHFVAIGDSADSFRQEALKLCEAVLRDAQSQLARVLVEVKPPATELVLVILGSKRSYAHFNGEPLEEAGEGHYDLETNRLVIFDSREKGRNAKRKTEASRYNTFTLVHELMHQIVFNGGVLSRTCDVPKAISEGFATYGELWREKAPKIGQENRPRLQVLADPKHVEDWIPIRRLIAEDQLFDQEATEQMAYAEAWLLVYTMLKSHPKAMRDYLQRIRERKPNAERVNDAEAAFGAPLERLDMVLSNKARRLIEG